MAKNGKAKEAEVASGDAGETQQVGENDLEKALNLLGTVAQSTDDEKKELLSKAMDGTISQEENDRLTSLLSGRAEASTIKDEVVKSLKPESDDRLQKSLDVSEYLDAQHDGLVKSLEKVADALEKSDTRQHNFNVILAKSMRALGTLAKSLDDRMAAIEAQPASAPKAMRSPAQGEGLAKSFAGTGGQGVEEKLSKSEILDTLESMNLQSMEKGRGGAANCGEDLTKAITKMESQSSISPALMAEVKQFRAAASR